MTTTVHRSLGLTGSDSRSPLLLMTFGTFKVISAVSFFTAFVSSSYSELLAFTVHTSRHGRRSVGGRGTYPYFLKWRDALCFGHTLVFQGRHVLY